MGDKGPGGPAGSTAAVEVRLLGGFGLLVDDKPVSIASWRLRKAKDVVKLLALAPGHRRHRDEVIEALWPERDPDSGLNNLHQALHIARRGLAGSDSSGRGRLGVRQEWVALCPDEKLLVDVEQFEAAAASADGSADPGLLTAALCRYTGDLLPEDRYEDWVVQRRDELRARWRRLVTSLAALREAAGDPGAAVDLLTRLVADDPADEMAQRALMRAYALSGDRGAALRQHQALVAVLQDELAVSPDAQTERVYQDVLAGKLSSGGPGTASGDNAGKHRTAPSPERGRSPRRHPRQPSVSPRDGHNLPVTLSTFIGRDQALAELSALLGERRLITLTGPGGCGKTRLAVEVARRALPRFPDGAWLIELAAAAGTDDHAIGRALAQALSLREQAGQSPLDAVIADLTDRRALLVIDNCEHRIEGAARIVAALLRASPELVVLATSREPLRVPGEMLWQVPSLGMADPRDLPTLADLGSRESVRLFVERAMAAEPGFRLNDGNAARIAEICFRLDGLPLAIELAAARIPALGVAGVADGLDDRFMLLTDGSRSAVSRQRTLAATFDWSYELLSGPERVAFRRLSVFAELFSLPAALAVATGRGCDRDKLAVVLPDLVARSMVTIEQDEVAFRYRLIETLREYGRERLAEAGETEIARQRHAAWFLTVAREAAGHFADPGRRIWFERIDADLADLQTALDTLIDADPAGALRLAAAMWPYWVLRGSLGEGIERLDAALGAARGEAPQPSAVRVEALLGRSAMQMRWAAMEDNQYQEQALEEAWALGDPLPITRTAFFIGVQAWTHEDSESARSAFLMAATTARTAGLVLAEASAVHALACVAWSQGRTGLARRRLRQALTLARRAVAQDDAGSFWPVTLGGLVTAQWLGAPRLMFEEGSVPFQESQAPSAVAHVRASMGSLARSEGDYGSAHGLLEEALARFEDTGDEAGVALAFGRLGNLAIAAGEDARAWEHLGRSLVIRRHLQDQRGIGLVLMSLARLEAGAGRMDRASDLLAQAVGIFRVSGDRPAMIGALLRLGELQMARAEDGPAGAGGAAASGGAVPGGAASGGAMPGGAASGGAMPGGALSGGAELSGPDQIGADPRQAAVRLLESAVANLRVMGSGAFMGLSMAALAEAYARSGAPQRAADTAREALTLLVHGHPEPGREQTVRRLSELAALRG